MKTPEELAEKWAKLESANLDIDCDVQNGADYATVCSACRHIYYAAIKAFIAGYAAAQPKWISVEERLPELGLHVLTYGIYTKDLIVAWLDDCDEFLGVYDWVNEHQSLDQVTHWMPLPEPPKENE